VGFAHVAEADDTESDDFHSGVQASGLVWRVKVEVGVPLLVWNCHGRRGGGGGGWGL
jgi:hypothetical protein